MSYWVRLNQLRWVLKLEIVFFSFQNWVIIYYLFIAAKQITPQFNTLKYQICMFSQFLYVKKLGVTD